MADNTQARASETEIHVDVNAADPNKAVTRRPAKEVNADRDEDERPISRVERDMRKRMTRLEKNLTRQFDQRQAERDAAHQRELSELRAKLERTGQDRDTASADDIAHENAIKALKDKLAAAYEKGDSQASAEITLEISKLDARFWAKKEAQAGVTSREQARPQAAAATTAAPAKTNGPTVAGSKFIKANDDWWDDPDYAVEQSAANTIYLKLVNEEGFDAKDSETFKEVAKQLKAKFPKLKVASGARDADDDELADDEDEDDVRRQPVRRNAATQNIADRGPNDNPRRSGTMRQLTEAEKKTMRDCRLDPDNDRDVVQFVREAMAMEQAQA